MGRPQRKPIGELLLEAGVLTQEQLDQAVERQQTVNDRLGRVLVAMGIPEQAIARALAQQLHLPTVDLRRESLDAGAGALLPEALARKYSVVPVRREGDRLVLAMADPLDVLATDDAARATGLTVSPVIASESEVRAAIERAYGIGGRARGIIEEITPAAGETAAGREADAADADRADAPVVRLADLILTRGVQDRASDVHLEPMEGDVRVRYRVDGVLRTVMTVPTQAYVPLVSRFKVMARMNVAERRVPQDGSFRIKVDGRDVDCRMSVIPLVHGERVALRLLDKSRAILDLTQLGMDTSTLAEFTRLIHVPHGIILVTGPTGSGKTTTLVGSIVALNALDRNIITVEDPVEYQIPGVNQMEVNPRAGLTFATALRSIVRQDPDIVMVGEIRDVETAEIAIHASLTGHLVLSTVHTNDAPSAIARLTDMGIEPFLIASSLAGTLSQRLVRLLCPRCKRPVQAAPDAAALLHAAAGAGAAVETYEPVGCAHCQYTGYFGRTGIFELLNTSGRIRRLVQRRAASGEIAEAARGEGMRTIREDGLRKVAAGLTTLEEVLRATRVADVE